MSKLKDIGGSLLISATVIPMLGILAHIGGTSNQLESGAVHFKKDAYSLQNRFECAYDFKTPENHKTYFYASPEVSGGIRYGYTPYLASPYATYPAHLLVFGLSLMALRALRAKNNGK